MSVLTERDVFEIEREGPSLWWLFLVTGIGWVLVSFMVLAFNPTTPATIGYLAGFVLLAAGRQRVRDDRFRWRAGSGCTPCWVCCS